jgi:hypothetical protein
MYLFPKSIRFLQPQLEMPAASSTKTKRIAVLFGCLVLAAMASETTSCGVGVHYCTDNLGLLHERNYETGTWKIVAPATPAPVPTTFWQDYERDRRQKQQEDEDSRRRGRTPY